MFRAMPAPQPTMPKLPRPAGQPGAPTPATPAGPVGAAPRVATPQRPQVARPASPVRPPQQGVASPGVPAVDPAPAGPPAGGTPPTPTGPATTPAPNAPAPAANPQPAPLAPVGAIATPATAGSQPLEDSPWAYEKMWGALGGIGDPELDSAVKGATMGLLKENPWDKAALARAQTTNFETGMGDLRSTQEGINADLVRRGLSDTGLGAELGAEAEMAARAGVSAANRQTSQEFAQQGAKFKQDAAAQAQSLASDLAKRGVDIENLRMQREQLARQIQAQRAAGGGGASTIEIMNPDGSVSEVPLDILDMVLGMGEGGYDYDE